ncbi:GspH/FimT family pseudopilin [Gallaecimonas sp. GXIMD4217]|uniref:GspH/FimT family pseudopilin n=1 Tax=Gallaecimonas sp. GXIMD4217 TaxID=3131927 RepID=UPI00311B2A03
MAKSKGFTLLELMITLVVLAVLVGIAVPSFTAVADQRNLNNAAEELRMQILYAKSESIRLNQDLTFFFSTTGGWCAGVTDAAITNGSNCDCGDIADKCPLVDSDVVRAFVGTDFPTLSFSSSYGGSQNKMTVKARNGQLASGNVKVSLVDDANEAICIKVSAMGRVRTCDYDGSSCSCG